MLRSLEGKIALVTGAGQGNGAAMAKGLAQAGARVVVTDLNGETAKLTAEQICTEGGEAIAFTHDVALAEDSLRLAEAVYTQWGDIDILVNNAGVLLRGKVTDDDARRKWRKTMDVNVDGPYNVTMAFLEQLKRTQGCVVNIASIQAFVAPPISAAYTASKGAVKQLTKALATELIEFGIRVNAIAPGAFETPMTEYSRSRPEAMSALVSHTPMKRFGKPEELVGPLLFLSSEMSSYVTGVIVPVDGGYLTL